MCCVLIIQSLEAWVTWEECCSVPTAMCQGKAVVLNDNVYYGGGESEEDSSNRNVFCYGTSSDTWKMLPSLSVKWFGLGQINGNLVAVGGKKDDTHKVSNEIYTFNEKSQKWKKAIASMPTARYFPTTVSLPSALVVAGGLNSDNTHIPNVDIYDTEKSTWYTTESIPAICSHLSLQLDGGLQQVFAVGGSKYPLQLNQALFASATDLLRISVQSSKDAVSPCASSQSVWQTMPNTPNYQPAAVMLADRLLAIGGEYRGSAQRTVHMYLPLSETWIYINDIPSSRSKTTAVTLSSRTEVLVIGGCNAATDKVNTVYKGTLNVVA